MQRGVFIVSVLATSLLGGHVAAQAPVQIVATVTETKVCKGDAGMGFDVFFLRFSVRNISSTRVSITTPVILLAKVSPSPDPSVQSLMSRMVEDFGVGRPPVHRFELMSNEAKDFNALTSVPISPGAAPSTVGPGKYWLHLIVGPRIPFGPKPKTAATLWTDEVNVAPIPFSVPPSWTAVTCKY
jgi:hypothetical protein